MKRHSHTGAYPALLTTSIFVIALLMTGCDALPGVGDSSEVNEVELLPVLLKGEWGYVDHNGRIRIEPDFRSAGEFSEGLAAAKASYRYGYIDEHGEWVIDPRFEDAQRFSDGLAAVRIDSRWGYIDRRGTVVINPMFVSAHPFSEDRAFVRTAEYDWEYIDKSGVIVRTSETPEFDSNENASFSEGVALYEARDGTYGFVDRDGNPVIPAQYASAQAFSEGKAAIKISDRWGYIDRGSKTVISPQFISAGSFGNKLAPVRRDGNTWGYVDDRGNVVIQETFEEARRFSDGVAAVMENGKWGFINRSGEHIIDAQFDDVRDFKNGVGRVTVLVGERTKYGYLDSKGAYVWFPTD